MGGKKRAQLFVREVINKKTEGIAGLGQPDDSEDTRRSLSSTQADRFFVTLHDMFTELQQLRTNLITTYTSLQESNIPKAIAAWEKKLKSPEQAVAIMRLIQKPLKGWSFALSIEGAIGQSMMYLSTYDTDVRTLAKSINRQKDEPIAAESRSCQSHLIEVSGRTLSEDIGVDTLSLQDREKLVSILEDVISDIHNSEEAVRDAYRLIDSIFTGKAPGSNNLRQVITRYWDRNVTGNSASRKQKSVAVAFKFYEQLAPTIIPEDFMSESSIGGLLEIAATSAEDAEQATAQALIFVKSSAR